MEETIHQGRGEAESSLKFINGGDSVASRFAEEVVHQKRGPFIKGGKRPFIKGTHGRKPFIGRGGHLLREGGGHLSQCRKIREKPRCANMVLICAHQVIRFQDAFQPQNLRIGVIDPLAWISNYWTF